MKNPFARSKFYTATAFVALALAARAVSEDVPRQASIAEQEPPRTIAEEASVLEKGRLGARRRALARLAAHPDPAANKVLLAQFERLAAGQLPPAIWLDLVEAAAKRDDPQLKAKLAEREKTLAESKDPLSRLRECLEGGDAEAGRVVFTTKLEAGCIRCHSAGGEGGNIGPDLTWLRNAMDRILILESIIVPSAVIAPGFASASLTLKSGETVSGVATRENQDELTITSVVDGKRRTVKTSEIAERTPLPSPMPPHFGAALSKREIRDLVEFIAVGD